MGGLYTVLYILGTADTVLYIETDILRQVNILEVLGTQGTAGMGSTSEANKRQDGSF